MDANVSNQMEIPVGKRNTKVAVLFSGGFDSGAVYLKAPKVGVDYIFFEYGQIYMVKERQAAVNFLKRLDLHLNIISIPGHHDMEGRNFKFLDWCAEAGYTDVYIGTRCPLPWFDKYGDANYFSLNCHASKLNIKVHFPIMLWSKKKVFEFLEKYVSLNEFYNCYANKDNYRTCDCSNCLERKKYES